MLRMILVLLLFAGGTLAGLQSAVIASCFFIWNDIFRPSEWARYFGVLNSDTFTPVHITTAVLALSILLRPWKKRWNIASTALLVLLGWIFISALMAQIKDVAMERAYTVAKYILPLALISATLCTRRAQHFFLYTLGASVGLWMAHHGLLSILKGGSIIRMSIPGGQMSDRNDFMVAGTACIPLLLYMAWHYDYKWSKWVRPALKAAVGFSVIALFASESRGAVLGFSALLLFWGTSTGHLFKKLSAVLIIGLIAVMLMPGFVWERMATIEVDDQQTEASAAARIEHMVTAFEVTLDYPVTGVGPDNFTIVSQRYSQYSAEPHSLWLKCSSEYGIPLLMFFAFLVLTLLVRLLRTAREARARGDKQTEALATTLSCALFGFLATGTFTSQFLSEYFWALVALSGAFLATPRNYGLDESELPAEVTEANAPAMAGG